MTARRFLLVLVLTVIVNGVLIVRVSGWGWKAELFSLEGALPLRDGDLVLRCSKGLVGEWFRKTSLKDRRFSHAGIFIMTQSGPKVAHISQDRPAGLKFESFEQFCSGRISESVGWVRTDLTERERVKLKALVDRELGSGRVFDESFSLEDHNKQYCTEWVRNVYTTATGDSVYFPVTEVDGFRYVAPDNLYLNNHSTLIRTFEP